MADTEKMVRRQVMFTESDDQRLKRAAKGMGLDVSTYIRMRMLPILTRDLQVQGEKYADEAVG